MWKAFCEALGAPGMVEKPQYATSKLRHENRVALIAEIEAATGKQPVSHWLEAFDKARIPCGPVYTMDQVFADPQVQHLRVARDVDWPAIGKAQVIAQEIRQQCARFDIGLERTAVDLEGELHGRNPERFRKAVMLVDPAPRRNAQHRRNPGCAVTLA